MIEHSINHTGKKCRVNLTFLQSPEIKICNYSIIPITLNKIIHVIFSFKENYTILQIVITICLINLLINGNIDKTLNVLIVILNTQSLALRLSSERKGERILNNVSQDRKHFKFIFD